MEEILKEISSDKEIQELKKEWARLYEQGLLKEPCLGFNFDEYSDIDDYKKALKSGVNSINTSS